MVFLLSQLLKKQKISHAIVSRGYKRKSKNLVVVSNEKGVLADYSCSGDEPLLLAQKLPGVPVVVGNKIKAIQKIQP